MNTSKTTMMMAGHGYGDSPGSGRAVVLVSGGLDSATVLAVVEKMGYGAILALSFDYGQRHRAEIFAAHRVVAACKAVVDHRIVRIDLGSIGGSALTDPTISVPQVGVGIDARDGVENAEKGLLSTGIPVTYVPARNTIFLAYALAYAEVWGSRDIFIGVNAVDYSGYPDCRPQYIQKFNELANLATSVAVGVGAKSGRSGAEEEKDEGVAEGYAYTRIHAPLIELTKGAIIALGLENGVDYSMTLSCYSPEGSEEAPLACGRCEACSLRLAGFAANGVADPASYVGE